MVDFISKKLGGVDLNERKRQSSPKQFKLAPSQYGMFISLNCKLFLRRSSTQHVRDTKGKSTSNSVSERMQLRGSEWEARICEDLALACGSNPNAKYTDCTTLDFPAFVESILSSESVLLTHYMYQATLNIDEDGVPAELQKVDASLSRLIPDLLKLSRQSVEDPWTLTVIDAKSSLNLRTSHQAQVAFYSYFLGQVFSEEIDRGLLRMSDTGGVWLQPVQTDASVPLRISLQEFHLKPWLKLLMQHLQSDIPDALSGHIEDVPWHLNAHCSSCPYLSDCRADKSYGADIRALPHVPAGDSKLLQNIAFKYAEQVDPTAAPSAVSTLRAALNSSEMMSVESPVTRQRALRAVGASSSPGARNFGAVTSILERRTVLKEQLCGTYPANSDGIAVFVTLCCDPALGFPYAWAIGGAGQNPTSEFATFTANPLEMKAREERVLLALLTRLCEIVEGLRCPPNGDKGVTLYMWDAMEKFCLTQLVIKSLCGEYSAQVNAVPGLTARVHYLALVLLDHPQRWHLHVPPSPDLLAANSTPRMCELTSQYRALVHLPIAGFYSSADIAVWVRAHTNTISSHDISLDGIERAWTQSADISTLLNARLTDLVAAENYLRSTVVSSSRRLLFNKSAPLPDRATMITSNFPVGNAIVQRLVFMKHVDVLVRCTTARQKRIAALNNPSQQIRLQCVRKDKNMAFFEQLSGPAVFADSAANEFIKKWCLTKEDAEIVANFADMCYLTEKLYCPDRAVAFVTVKNVVTEVRDSGVVCIVQCTLPSNAVFVEGDTCVLFAREVDLNLAKSIDSLTLLGHGALPHTFVELVDNPNSWDALPVTHPPTAPSFVGIPCSTLDRSRVQANLVYQNVISLTGDTTASPFAKVAPLSGVQAQAFQQLLHDKLTIVWGPPGTGKTHFAAKSMLNLVEMATRHGSVPHLRILVCATTHAAIDEILSKFVMLKSLALSIPDRQDIDLWKDQCKVFKYKAKPTNVTEALEGVQYTEGPTVVAKCKYTVLGATTWSLYKKKKSKAGEFGAFEKDFRGLFDVVVIDEASQMPVSDALMPLSCLKEGPGGRLLVVGDTMQLPPIFAYKFGTPPTGVPPVQSSVLECLLRTEENRPVDLSSVIEGSLPPPPRMIKLSENFRMNTALSKFTSRLYGSDYVPSGSSRNRSGLWAVKPGATLRTLLPGIFTSGRSALPELVSLRLVPHKTVRKYSTHALRSNAPAATTLVPMTADELALTSEMDHIAAEAHMVAALIEGLAGSQENISMDETAASLFACTPHNNQKASLTRALGQKGHTGGCWGEIADTRSACRGKNVTWS